MIKLTKKRFKQKYVLGNKRNIWSLDHVAVGSKISATGDYLMKSNPPQREFLVEFRMQDDSNIKKIINIFDLGNL